VEKMAGMPNELIERANQILQQLEGKELQQEYNSSSSQKLNIQPSKSFHAQQVQLSIFDAHTETFERLRNMLAAIDINRLTPVEALMKLNEVKDMLK
jgi:DNA mismatch repair protein MutS